MQFKTASWLTINTDHLFVGYSPQPAFMCASLRFLWKFWTELQECRNFFLYCYLYMNFRFAIFLTHFFVFSTTFLPPSPPPRPGTTIFVISTNCTIMRLWDHVLGTLKFHWTMIAEGGCFGFCSPGESIEGLQIKMFPTFCFVLVAWLSIFKGKRSVFE